MSKRKEVEPRYCKRCGEFIPRNGMIYQNYMRKVFCSEACQRAKTVRPKKSRNTTPPTKVCPVCGKTFIRYAGQPAGAWAHQKYCSLACRPNKPFADSEDATCQCGQPATDYVYFIQGRADGSTMRACLGVCADCRDYMLDVDSGCSSTPMNPTIPCLWRNIDDDTPLPYSPPHGGFANRRTYHD